MDFSSDIAIAMDIEQSFYSEKKIVIFKKALFLNGSSYLIEIVRASKS